MTTEAPGREAKPAEATAPLVELVGAGLLVPCLDGTPRPTRDLDCAASTPAMAAVAARVAEFLPVYSSVHRGPGYKSRVATAAYEAAREDILEFCGRRGTGDIAIVCRNTTEALNHLAFQLRLGPDDVVVTTVVEHHANLLPWGRTARRRYVECGRDGTFGIDDVVRALDGDPRPRLVAVTGATNVTGWLPPVEEICEEAHARGIPVVVDAAQRAPHRPLPTGPDFVAFSGHKMYAPFGAGALVGPRSAFTTGDPYLAGGGAVTLVDLDEVVWNDPPDREEAGSPNVVGAVALGAALQALGALGWDAICAHERALAERLRRGLAAIDGVCLLGPSLDTDTQAVAAFVIDGVPFALAAARLSVEYGIAVRHGCFCAHPSVHRLLGLPQDEVARAKADAVAGDKRRFPGAVRASCGLGTTVDDVDALVAAVGELARGGEPPVPYVQDVRSGDYYLAHAVTGWPAPPLEPASDGRG